MGKKDYDCKSVYKGNSEKDIRSRLRQLWGRYIRQQEEGKKV